jgi:predicted transcriptional regulator
VRRNRPLSDLQVALLRILWLEREATVARVQEALQPERNLALTTVATLLARLESRGVVSRRMDGRQFVYRADVGEAEVRRSMVSALTERLFGGDPAALVHHLIDEGAIDAQELARLRALLEEREPPPEERRGR